MPIKVLVISNYNDIHSSRPEAEIFIGLAKLGLEIEIMTSANSPYIERLKSAGIKVINFFVHKKFDKKEIAFIRKTLIEGKHDILHLYNSPATINGIRAAKKLPVKVVLYRGIPGHIHWYDPSLYFKYFHPRVDKIVCNSKRVEELFHEQLFFDKSKAVTINKGHMVEWYQNTKPADRKSLGVSDDDFVVVFVGNNRPVKGVPYLLEAFDYIPSELPIKLLIVGKNMDNEINHKIINKCPNKKNIFLLGFKDNPLQIVAASDTLVLSSLYYESITKSVFEAMSLGIAPIITNLAGNREFVGKDYNTVMLVPPKNAKAIADAILELYHNPEKRKEIGQNASRHISENLSNTRSVLEMKKFYEELAADK